MKSRNMNYLITILFIISFLFLVTSTINFAYRLPKLENELRSNEKWLSNALHNHLIHEIYRQEIDTIDNQFNILKEINPNSTKLQDIYNQSMLKRRVMLMYAHTSLLGHPASEETINKWESLTMEELNIEYKKLSGTYIQDTQESVNDASRRKAKIMLYSIILQVFGLLLAQVAVVMSIWKKNNIQ